MTTTAISLTKADIESLPNRKQKSKTSHEYSSTCPACGGTKRFLYWDDTGNYWCRECCLKGFVKDSLILTLPPAEYAKWKQEQEEREAAAYLPALERIANSPNAERYHRQMSDRGYWYRQGLNDETIDKYQLGYSEICPTYPGSASWTIPIKYQNRLYNIRHRLVSPNGCGKYRPEMAGLPNALFDADVLANPDWQVIIVEGEVKAMMLTQCGFCAVGVPGASSFKSKWLKLFPAGVTVYIAFDPGAEEQAIKTGALFGAAGFDTRVCHLPAKPDDMLVLYGASVRDMAKYFEQGYRIK